MNILLTGASKGIGEGIRKVLEKAGHRVIGMSRSISSEHDIQCDLSKAQNFRRLFNSALDRLPEGEVFDVLINNAGICHDVDFEAVITENLIDVWKVTFDVNLFSCVALTKQFVRSVCKVSREGRVINLCSRVAFKGQASNPHYAASKAALLNFTRSMAANYAAKKIAFFSVSPCWVATEMANEPMEKMTWDIPAKTIARIDDITPAIRFLVEDATMFMTGMNMDINGASYFH